MFYLRMEIVCTLHLRQFSNGGSVYNTEVEVVQNALENHYRYNDLFVLDREERY